MRHYLQLSPRQLPSTYLYDALGSALFDAICELPWYAITRAETRLLERHRAAIFARLDRLTRLVELGPGDGRKLKTLVEGTSGAVDRTPGRCVRRRPRARGAHAVRRRNLRVVTHQAPFEDGLDAIMREEPGDAHAGAVPRLEHRQLRRARVRTRCCAASPARSDPAMRSSSARISSSPNATCCWPTTIRWA